MDQFDRRARELAGHYAEFGLTIGPEKLARIAQTLRDSPAPEPGEYTRRQAMRSSLTSLPCTVRRGRALRYDG